MVMGVETRQRLAAAIRACRQAIVPGRRGCRLKESAGDGLPSSLHSTVESSVQGDAARGGTGTATAMCWVIVRDVA
jgi:hypothetical protein